MFRLFKHYVPHAVVWLALIEFLALLGSAEAAWRLYAHFAGFDAGLLGGRWLPLTTFAVANSLAMMATGMYGNEALRSMKFATARLLAAVSLGVIFLSVVGFLLPTATLWRVNSLYAMATRGPKCWASTSARDRVRRGFRRWPTRRAAGSQSPASSRCRAMKRS